MQTLRSAISEVINSFSRICTKKVFPMCQYYGHVTKKSQGQFERSMCDDCGAEIMNADMLRKAAPVHLF
jgi:hypothetical protein